jgi:hypothetical protein
VDVLTALVIRAWSSPVSAVRPMLRWASNRRVQAAALVVSVGTPVAVSSAAHRRMSLVVGSPDSDSRSAGSVDTSTALSWLMAWVRDLTAESLASLNIRAISTGPSPVLAVAVARPASTARAAASASTASVLPRRRLVALSG